MRGDLIKDTVSNLYVLLNSKLLKSDEDEDDKKVIESDERCSPSLSSGRTPTRSPPREGDIPPF